MRTQRNRCLALTWSAEGVLYRAMHGRTSRLGQLCVNMQCAQALHLSRTHPNAQQGEPREAGRRDGDVVAVARGGDAQRAQRGQVLCAAAEARGAGRVQRQALQGGQRRQPRRQQEPAGWAGTPEAWWKDWFFCRYIAPPCLLMVASSE